MSTHAHLLRNVNFYLVLTADSDILFCPRLLMGCRSKWTLLWPLSRQVKEIIPKMLKSRKVRSIIEVILENKNKCIVSFTHRYSVVPTDSLECLQITCVLWKKCATMTVKNTWRLRSSYIARHLQSKSLQPSFSQSYSFLASSSHIDFHSWNIKETNISGSWQ